MLQFLGKNNRWAIILVLLLVLVGGWFLNFQNNKINDLKDKYQSEVNLKTALLDSVHIYQNKEKEWVAEKLTIQASVTELQGINNQLTSNQKKLLAKIKEVNKENTIITAALIQANFIVDSLYHNGLVVVDTLNKTVKFIEENDKNIQYEFIARGVLPYPVNIKPTLIINKLYLPNTQFIEFHWIDNKKEGFPIAFSVTNSNDYVKVQDIDSYAIPEIKKDIVKPNDWQKLGQWFSKNGRFVGGLVVGAGGMYLLLK